MIIAGCLLVIGSIVAASLLSKEFGRRQGYEDGWRDGAEAVYDRCAGKWNVTMDAARKAMEKD